MKALLEQDPNIANMLDQNRTLLEKAQTGYARHASHTQDWTATIRKPPAHAGKETRAQYGELIATIHAWRQAHHTTVTTPLGPRPGENEWDPTRETIAGMLTRWNQEQDPHAPADNHNTVTVSTEPESASVQQTGEEYQPPEPRWATRHMQAWTPPDRDEQTVASHIAQGAQSQLAHITMRTLISIAIFTQLSELLKWRKPQTSRNTVNN